MSESRAVFAQLRDFLPKYEFDKCVARYHGNFRVRKPSTATAAIPSPIANNSS